MYDSYSSFDTRSFMQRQMLVSLIIIYSSRGESYKTSTLNNFPTHTHAVRGLGLSLSRDLTHTLATLRLFVCWGYV